MAVNAGSANNLSVSGGGVFTTFDNDFSSVRPLLNVTPEATDAFLKWIEVPGATGYEATVATRVSGEPVPGVTVAWDNNKYPVDWSFPGGSFDTRDDYVGQASPSLRIVNGTALTTGIYDRDIKSFKMWARTSQKDTPISLKFYAVEPNYSVTPITEITSLECSKEGTQVEINNMPDGLRQLLMVYSSAGAGTTVNIDDLTIDFVSSVTDTPVNGYDACHVDGTYLKAEGLTPMTDYVAYVRALKGSEASAMSKTVYFSTADPSGVEGIESPEAAFTMTDGVVTSQVPVDIFTLNGVAVALQATGSVRLPDHGIYLVRSNGRVTKVVW